MNYSENEIVVNIVGYILILLNLYEMIICHVVLCPHLWISDKFQFNYRKKLQTSGIAAGAEAHPSVILQRFLQICAHSLSLRCKKGVNPVIKYKMS